MGHPALDRSPTQAAKRAASKLGCGFLMLGYERFSLVDLDTLPLLEEHLWQFHTGGYAFAVHWINQRRVAFYLHRLITNAPKGSEVDHINRNKLDNRFCNLRLCTSQNNSWNAKKTTRQDATSRFKGVTLNRPVGSWIAKVKMNYKSVNLGSFRTEIEAARAYDAWARKNFGEFAACNFPEP